MADRVDLESGREKSSSFKTLFSNTITEPHHTSVDVSVLAPIVADPEHSLLSHARGISLEWYAQWLNQRFESIPPAISNSLGPLGSISREVAEGVKRHCTIEEIATGLVYHGLITSTEGDHAMEIARAITFGFVGWQSMLYDPILTTIPSSKICISDVLDGHRGTAWAATTVSHPTFSSSLPELLIRFGLMLPKQNSFTGEDEDSEAFEKIAFVTPGGFNAATLTSLAHLKIEWVDFISPHLELDKATNTIFLYRYPSFCLANLCADGGTPSTGVVHGLAAADHDQLPWATEADTTQLLKEVLLSYRLLFGQNTASQRLIRGMRGVDKGHLGPHDPFLAQICGARRPEIPGLVSDRESYRLSRDFPVLRQRIAILQTQLLSVKPRGWKAIWADKRDTVQWWTFWAVIFFGGMGVFLSALQVILQAIQVFGS